MRLKIKESGMGIGLENISAFYLNKKSAQSAIATMIKKGIVAKVGKNQWKKLKTNIYDTPVFS